MKETQIKMERVFDNFIENTKDFSVAEIGALICTLIMFIDDGVSGKGGFIKNCMQSLEKIVNDRMEKMDKKQKEIVT